MLLHSCFGAEYLFTGQGLWQQGFFLRDEGTFQARFRHISFTSRNSQTFSSSTSSPRRTRKGMAWQRVRAVLQSLRPTDRQTDRQISVGSRLTLPVPSLSGAGLPPSPPVWSRPVSALPWLRELRRECGHRPGSSAGAAGAAAIAGPADPAHPAALRARMRARGSVAATGRGAGLVSILPFSASSGSREKTFVPTHAGLPSCVRRFDSRGRNPDRFLCQRESRIQEPQSAESPKDFR